MRWNSVRIERGRRVEDEFGGVRRKQVYNIDILLSLSSASRFVS
jgi:hypothetical protein